MRLLKPIARPLTRGVVALLATGLILATGARAQSNSDFLPQITIVELMDSIVMPSAQIVWDAVAYEVSTEGETVTGPETDEDWQALRWSAVALAESANNLVVPGRAVNQPDAVAAEGELDPVAIEALIESEHSAWVAHAHLLYEAAIQAVNAIDARDPQQVSDAGGTIDAACESCHLQFWYPEP